MESDKVMSQAGYWRGGGGGGGGYEEQGAAGDG